MKLRIALTLAALGALAAGSATAQPSPEIQAALQGVRTSCEADAKTLCADKQGREMFMCLRENQAKASKPCQDALSKLPQRPAGAPAPGGR